MKNSALLLIALCILCIETRSQFLTQSAEGKSSIPLPLNGLGVGIDIGKSEVAFGLNNYSRVFSSENKKFKNNYFMGLNVTAKNDDGLAKLFSSGDIVPAGNLLGFFGYSFSNHHNITKAWNDSKIDDFRNLQFKIEDSLFAIYKNEVSAALAQALPAIEEEFLRNSANRDLSKAITDAVHTASIEKAIKTYRIDLKQLDRFKLKMEELMQEPLANFSRAFYANREFFDKHIDTAFKQFTNKWIPWRITPFFLGGIQARSFTRFLALSTPDFTKSFQDTLFRGGSAGLGLNIQVANYWFGITYSYVKRDNFVRLKSREYNLRTTDTTGNQALIREKKYTAYSGKYSRVEVNELNMDLVGDYFLNDSSRLLANLYLRGSIKSRDTSYLPNYTNIGAGMYFIGKKGKFLGGLYVELPDVNNNMEKAKPVDDQHIQSPFKKLTFGIVTKFNISSVFGWMNRPAKPD